MRAFIPAAILLAALTLWFFWPKSNPDLVTEKEPTATNVAAGPNGRIQQAAPQRPKLPAVEPGPASGEHRDNAPLPNMNIDPPTTPPGRSDPSETLAENFASEIVETTWAGEKQALVDQTVRRLIADSAAHGQGVSLGAIECRRRTCKIELSAANEAGLARVIDALSEAKGFLRQGATFHLQKNATPNGGSIHVFVGFPR